MTPKAAANLSQHNTQSLRTIQKNRGLVRPSYRRDEQGRWFCRSWSDPTVEYEQHWRISGHQVQTSCSCPAGVNGLLCRHQMGLVELVIPECVANFSLREHVVRKWAEWGRIA